MRLSPSVFKIAICIALGFAPKTGFSRAAYMTNGAEYPISGSLPGEQLRPSVSVKAGGGFLVWEDNFIDARGLGIGAVALNSSFGKSGEAFRVNQVGVEDQERPQVSLLKNGGAAFVWQGGKRGFQHIYARFLSASNTWVGGDIMVNSLAGKFQQSPTIATLANGNVVVVWNSWNQVGAGSMYDVYGQILSPAGEKIGSEFRVNQFSSYNQRTPSVAAFPGSGFIVAWVSELQRGGAVDQADADYIYGANNQPKVDIYARAFSDGGNGNGDEFLVNTSTDTCSHPSVAVGTNGGYVIAWAQFNSSHYTNEWDIFARGFDASGSGGVATPINSYVTGSQISPSIQAIGSDFLLVWTSLGQDGSKEGVFGRYVGSNASPTSDEFQVNSTVVNSQMQPALAADGSQRFLSVWTSFVGGGGSFDLFAQSFAASGYIPADITAAYASPATDPFHLDEPLPPVASGNPNDPTPVGLPGLALDFSLPEISGTVLENGMDLAKGNYAGLCFNTNAIGASSSGSFTAAVSTGGKFSAKILLNGRSYSLSGVFDASGNFSKTLTSKTALPLTASLQLDLDGGDRIRGHLSNAAMSAEIFANRATFQKTTHPFTGAGKYTVIIPGAGGSVSSPAGSSFGTAVLDASGNITFAGVLSDGTKVSQKTFISKDGLWPLYSGLYSGAGVLISWAQFSSTPTNDLSGECIWSKSRSSASIKYYSAGFTNKVELTGSAYNIAAAGKKSLVISGGGLSTSVSASFAIDAAGKTSNTSANKVALSLTVKTGLFKGTFINPANNKSVAFQGALLSKGSVGAGFFLGTGQCGQVDLSPATP